MKTQVLAVHPEFPELDKIAHCARVLRQGGLVVFPTETVYGIAADQANPRAMERLAQVKQRSGGKPFSVLISQPLQFLGLTPTNEPFVFKLIDRFWPGPLTIVVPANEPGQTIGVRMPDHKIALSLVREAQCTLAAPSANVEGHAAPVTCEEALRELDGLVDVAIDGGPARLGMGSTVVDCQQFPPKVLREGSISAAEIDRVARQKTILFVCTGNSCRSVMAQYLFRKLIGDREDVEVISGGTSVFVRSTASYETLMVLSREGIDASGHESRSINSIMLKKSDLICAMTRSHRQQVLEKVPDVEKRLYLLREFAPGAGSTSDLDVPDPIGRSAQDYEECLWLIKQAVDKIVRLI